MNETEKGCHLTLKASASIVLYERVCVPDYESEYHIRMLLHMAELPEELMGFNAVITKKRALFTKDAELLELNSTSKSHSTRWSIILEKPRILAPEPKFRSTSRIWSQRIWKFASAVSGSMSDMGVYWEFPSW
jgi:hypothetical protein